MIAVWWLAWASATPCGEVAPTNAEVLDLALAVTASVSVQQSDAARALLESLDVGKPIADTTGIDVPSAVRTIRWSGEAIDKVYDEIPPTPAGTLALVQRLPLGVVAAITPFIAAAPTW